MAIQTLFGTVPQEPNLLDRLKTGIQKTRSGLVDRLEDVLAGKKEIDAELLEELEYTLITADIGVSTVEDILERIRQRVDRRLTADAQEIRNLIREQLLEVLRASETPVRAMAQPPAVVMLVGVNGAGKTTTIGKLANRFLGEGRKVLLCAADTFRAAAIEQLGIWATRLDVEMIKGQYNADPAALCYEAYQAAAKRQTDFLLCDTAGRLHTKKNLMAELEKVKRILARHDPDAPHETLLVVDATTGGNALSQAREFQTAIGLTGVIVTKLDGSGKGGIVVAIQDELEIPTRFVGTGEQLDDFAPFDRQTYIENLL